MEKRHFYPVITAAFLGGTAAVAFSQGHLVFPQGQELILWGMAALRLGRLVAFDKVMEPERALFGIQTVPDGSLMGESTESRATGVRGALGDLVCCPTCAGTWAMALLLSAYQVPFLATWVTLVVAIMALAAVIDFGQAAIEYLEWNGQLGREYAGGVRASKDTAYKWAQGRPAPQSTEPMFVVRPDGEELVG